MSRVISFRDLLAVVPALKGHTEISLLDLSMDTVVNEALGILGFNLNAPILYVPNKHRDMAGKVGVGFRAVGEIDANNRTYLNSRVSLPIERVIATSTYDMSFTKELARLMGTSTADLRDTAILDTTVYEDDGKSQEYLEDDYEQVAEEIRELATIRDEIRGEKYNAHGGLKTPREYADDLQALLEALAR